jgi:CxxC motif-containing protein (DUF1111 family)
MGALLVVFAACGFALEVCCECETASGEERSSKNGGEEMRSPRPSSYFLAVRKIKKIVASIFPFDQNTLMRNWCPSLLQRPVPMSRTYRVWYLLVLLVALAPAGARLALWQRVRSIPVDAEMARAGQVLFHHEWKADGKDELCAEGDGLGPVFNANSCVACHKSPIPGGAGGLEHNVTTFTVRKEGQPQREGVLHSGHIPGVKAETLHDVDPSLPDNITKPTLEQIVMLRGQEKHCIPRPEPVHLSQRNTPALFGCKRIDEIPERVIIAGAKMQRARWAGKKSDTEDVPVGRALRLANGRIGRFGWKAQMASLSDFVQAACANELGLSNPGQAQPTPLYIKTPMPSSGLDLTQRQCDELTAFCASLARPIEKLPEDVTPAQANAGKKLFSRVGCAECHTPKLGDVDGLYSDLLLHRMSPDLVGGGSYGERPIPRPGTEEEGPSPSEWRTPPLWGVADSAPYMHDGRAPTLQAAIELHGGQAKEAAAKFSKLSQDDKDRLIAFLRTLRAP